MKIMSGRPSPPPAGNLADQQLRVPLYNIGCYIEFKGCIDPMLFEQAANLLVRKHDALRTRLLDARDEDGLPMQAFIDAGQFHVEIPIKDFSGTPEPHAAALAWMQKRFREPFQLNEGQALFHYALIRLADDRYYWLQQYHHLITDGWGVALLTGSLAGLYTQLCRAAPS
jgi:hypothetical protein